MMQIELPRRFEEKLLKDQKLSTIVKRTISDFTELLRIADLYFFPEYTDHGISHIQGVIDGGDKLIPPATFELLSPNDIATFVLSALAHDLGMHVEHRQFEKLVTSDSILLASFDKVSWRQGWTDYYYEARKFTRNKLALIFGRSDLDVESLDVLDKGKINDEGRKLVGEFLRRNHPRLAHEIVVGGFPLDKTSVIPFADGLDNEVKNLIGLTARSHGLDLREAVLMLEKKYPLSYRNIKGTNFIYCMVLLRLADYLHLERRSQTLRLKVKSFSVPFSVYEHHVHLAVDYIDDKYQNDPERIFIQATPSDSIVYIKLTNLLFEIQREFDRCWAILGEMYSRFPGKALEISFRRLSSNLELESFKKEINFIPRQYKFQVNNDLIKLLVKPLYGSDPSYGVRELVQNAVDACNERSALHGQGMDYEGQINVSVTYESSSDEYFFQISDNGKGMDEDDLEKFFFLIGASNRAHIELDQHKEHVKLLVTKSGKFGIGILSAFLLGKEMMVETKKPASTYGLFFKAGIDTEQIDVRKNYLAKDGTTIRIKVDKSFVKRLELDGLHETLAWFQWYTISTPKIDYAFLGHAKVPYAEFNPTPQIIPTTWNHFVSSGYDAILWTYDESNSKCLLTCNGFVVPVTGTDLNKYLAVLETKGDTISYNSDFNFLFYLPYLCIFDSRGILPLSLNRNTLTDHLTFAKDLRIEIVKDIIAKVITTYGHTTIEGNVATLGINEIHHPALRGSLRLFFTSMGFNLETSYFAGQKNHIHFVLEKASTSLQFPFKNNEVYTFEVSDEANPRSSRFLNKLNKAEKALQAKWMKERKSLIQDYIDGVLIVNKRKSTHFILEKDRYKSYLEGENAVVYSLKKLSLKAMRELSNLITPRNQKDIRYILYDTRVNMELDTKGIHEIFHEIFRDIDIIPFDRSIRLTKMKDIFEMLSKYLEKYK